MTKPTIYLDTNFISIYCYDGADVATLSRRTATRDWWNAERAHFSLWASAVTQDELRAGQFARQSECLRFVRRLSFLPITRQARSIAKRLVDLRVVPSEKPVDALQMAVCTAHRIDYLLSWNYAHLVNPIAQKQLETVCASLSVRAPLLVSPESIPRASLGQPLRRRKE